MWEWLVGLKRLPTVLGKVRELDRYEASLEARERALKAEEENSSLKAKLGELETQLRLRADLTYARNSYWRGEEGPFCSRCFDGDGKLVRLHTRPDDRVYADCPNCKALVQLQSEPRERDSYRGSYEDNY